MYVWTCMRYTMCNKLEQTIVCSRWVLYAGKSEQEVLHHWNARSLHSFGLSRERYKYLVICRHCLRVCIFYCLLWIHSWRSMLLLIPLLIYFVAVPPCWGKDVLLVVKFRDHSVTCISILSSWARSGKLPLVTPLKYNKKTAEATSFFKVHCR